MERRSPGSECEIAYPAHRVADFFFFSSAGLGPDRLTGATSSSLYVQSMDRRVRAFAPGRVNLIGEHTDYNDGLCLPFAIAHGVTVSVAPLRGREIEVRALDLGESDRFAPAACGAGAGRRAGRPPPAARRLAVIRPAGVVAQLRRSGIEAPPCGSRSAVTCRTPPAWRPRRHCVSVSMALCEALLGGDAPGPMELAQLCSRVENEWIGAETGLLDQLASLCGRPGRALRIDLRDLSLTPRWARARRAPPRRGRHRSLAPARHLGLQRAEERVPAGLSPAGCPVAARRRRGRGRAAARAVAGPGAPCALGERPRGGGRRR